jgi:uncharacterized protein YuzE
LLKSWITRSGHFADAEARMRLYYYPETDSLYVELRGTPGAETREIVAGLNVDLDAEGAVIGFDIDHASRMVSINGWTRHPGDERSPPRDE